MTKTVFTSQISFADAQMKAQLAGFKVIGSARNKRGEFVVFARQHNVGEMF